MFAILAVATFVLGAIVGSFLNVVIHRYPWEQESIATPASRCGSCRTPIKPYDNIPILSWLILRGRCRTCKAPFSSRYMLVELANGLFYLAIFTRVAASEQQIISIVAFVLVAAIASMTIVLIFIDLDCGYLPDVIDIPGIAIGIAIGSLGLGEIFEDLTLSVAWWEALAGAVLGAAILYVVNFVYARVRGVDGMGMGDMKMLAMIGAVTGWKAVLPILFLASVVGAVTGVALAARNHEGLDSALPFGVFLGIATLAVLFFGARLFQWYLSLISL